MKILLWFRVSDSVPQSYQACCKKPRFHEAQLRCKGTNFFRNYQKLSANNNFVLRSLKCSFYSKLQIEPCIATPRSHSFTHHIGFQRHNPIVNNYNQLLNRTITAPKPISYVTHSPTVFHNLLICIYFM